MAPKFTETQKREIVRLYNIDRTAASRIVEKIGVSHRHTGFVIALIKEETGDYRPKANRSKSNWLIQSAHKKEIIRLYKEGLSAYAISISLSLSQNMVPAIISFITEETGEYKTEAMLRKERISDITKLIKDGLTNKQITDKVGCNKDAICYARRLAGVPAPVPPRGEADNSIPEHIDQAEILKIWAMGDMSLRALGTKFAISERMIARIIDSNKPEMAGSVGYLKATVLPMPTDKPKRYIFTCAQNNTKVNEQVWRSLLALSKHYDAEIFVASFNYNRAAYGASAVKRDTETPASKDLWYDEAIREYLEKSDGRLQITSALQWCGEVNLSPTAMRPLTGFEDYTQSNSSIFPHPRLAMRSIPSFSTGAKLIYTTGTITQRNYIQKTAGQKAERHHAYGGLLVEVNADGSFFVRQLTSTDDGTIQDLNILVKKGVLVSKDASVSAINWGDIHVAYLQDEQRKVCWAKGGILDSLKPKYQLLHDTLDFYSRNHHELDNPHSAFKRFTEGTDDVAKEIQQLTTFLDGTQRPWCKTVLVESNHDNAFDRWLTNRAYDYRRDPRNARFFLQAQERRYQAIEERDDDFILLEWAIRRIKKLERVKFLKKDESFRIGLIECGIHGHNGPNGARGSPQAFSKLGFPMNIGHFHSAQILDGVFVAGLTANLHMDYSSGPSSWGHSHIITYPTGMRSILTTWRGEWRA